MIQKKFFIKKIVDDEMMKGHKGMTHYLLSVPKEYNLSHAETLLQKIVSSPIGTKIKNPLAIGKRYYTITPEMKSHVNWALNLIRIAEKHAAAKKRK